MFSTHERATARLLLVFVPPPTGKRSVGAAVVQWMAGDTSIRSKTTALVLDVTVCAFFVVVGRSMARCCLRVMRAGHLGMCAQRVQPPCMRYIRRSLGEPVWLQAHGGGDLAEHDGRWLQGTQSQLASVDSWIDFVRGLPADAPADALMSHSALRTTIVRIFDMRTADLAAAQNPEVEVESDSVFDSIAAYYRRQYAGDGDEVQVRPPPADAQQWPQRTP